MHITWKLIIFLHLILLRYNNCIINSILNKKVPNRILVQIIDLNNKGEGIAKLSTISNNNDDQNIQQPTRSNVINIPNTIPGDEVYVDIYNVTKTNSNISFIPKTNNKSKIENKIKLFNIQQYKLSHIKHKSLDRMNSLCNISDNCGGCQLQHQSYQAQLLFKKKTIEKIFDKQNCFTYDIINMIKNVTPSIAIYHYRNKLQFAIQYNDHKIKIGLYESNSNKVIDTNYCNIQHVYVNNLLTQIHKFLDIYGKKISIYDEITKQGSLRHIVIRMGVATEELMVCMVSATKTIPYIKEFIQLIRHDCDSGSYVKSILYNYNPYTGDQVLSANSNDTRILYGQPFINDIVAGIKVRVSLYSFMQSNPIQQSVLYSYILQFMEESIMRRQYLINTISDTNINNTVLLNMIPNKVNVWDMYCGVGTIGMFLSKSKFVNKIIGVENCLPAVNDAKLNAKLNQINNIQFICEKSENIIIQSFLINNHLNNNIICNISTNDIMILNPPRKGCDLKLLHALSYYNNTIIYISCNPITLVKDLEILQKYNYHIKAIQPVDMFPHTIHVEVVVLLEKNT